MVSSSDPWQMDNIYDEMKKSDPTMVKALRDETHRWFECKGTEGAEACPGAERGRGPRVGQERLRKNWLRRPRARQNGG